MQSRYVLPTFISENLKMTMHDQSYTDLLEAACGEHFLQRSRTDMQSDGRNTYGREQSRRPSDSLDSRSISSGKSDELIQMVARLRLRQEDQLNVLNMDRSFFLFAECGRGSLMPLLLKKSKY